MKKILKTLKYGLLACSITITVAGCSDFLNSDTPSIITDEYYNTKQGQEKLLIDIYYRYRSVFSTGEVQYFGTDLYMAITESPVERMFNGYDKTFNSTAPIVGGYWRNLYKIVQESNTLITRCTPEIAGNDYDGITSQGRFLRVLGYYYLVETFGAVPFYTTENTGIITETERTDEKVIYKFMIDELEAIKGKLDMTTKEPGRATNAAVLHLLGKLYLTRAYKSYAEATDFSNAASTLDELIEAPSQPYSLLASYADVYDENNQNNPEVIWAIQYGSDKNYIGNGNPQQSQFGFNITALEPDMFTKVQADYSSMSRYYWVIPKVHELFTDPVADTRYDATFKRRFLINNPTNAKFGDLGIYFPRWNDNSGMDEGAVKYYPFKSGSDYNWYPQSTALPILTNAIDRMPMIQKFKDTKIDWGNPGSREDVIFRLSDTYLLAAEAYLGAGNSSLALERINSIRKRAAKDENMYEQQMKLNSLTINTIMDERARELLGDHDRWFDLKRTNTLLTRVKEYNPFVAAYDNLNENHLVRPIPQDEINKIKGVGQNTGY
ncbi:RagB/SusD family nutrient uptake outer membrane protein [Dysgonomonas sp. GY75]|uniref:RagB/SusD family nutrient uptake outer membrane protein n=1 Tax=Dysgonomonas sp. GY75 TaxID=2780419 RepID=UPI0018837421|nr:RagB/SusD family nutrient uptake outer membrane protein [Dysgonomonas sp. GY75]MBF0651365.1 RagB/SusD family nutrient uptake outer membrane protein [Dysgonomonas sp. GY75]